jgi:hypothetical protein
MIPRIITNTTVTVHLDGQIITANSSHSNFTQIRAAALAQDWEAVRTLTNIAASIENWSDGEFKIVKDKVTYKGKSLPEQLEARIISFLEEGAPFDHLLAFYRRLVQNPSSRSVEQLYKFLEHENIPVGEDGCFYAYKAVQQDWYSISADRTTGLKTLNNIGATPTMARNEVNDDPTVGCSYGYHVGSLNYASNFGGQGSRLLICRIDPAHVVSVPHDCEYQKIRTSQYTVVQEYTGPLPSTFWSPSFTCGQDSPQSIRMASLENEIADCEDQLERLTTALEAAEDADAGPTVINALANAIADVEAEMRGLETDLDNLESELYEG